MREGGDDDGDERPGFFFSSFPSCSSSSSSSPPKAAARPYVARYAVSPTTTSGPHLFNLSIIPESESSASAAETQARAWSSCSGDAEACRSW